jgi:hypothetical protein
VCTGCIDENEIELAGEYDYALVAARDMTELSEVVVAATCARQSGTVVPVAGERRCEPPLPT